MKLPFSPVAVIFFPIALSCLADDNIYADQRVANPVTIPPPVMVYLIREVEAGFPECTQKNNDPQSLFEARSLSLNHSTDTILVKPKARCFCSGDGCPMWLFDTGSPQAHLIFESGMAGLLTLADRKTNGYADLSVSGGLRSKGYEVRYVWDGKEYQETYNHIWVWNPDRQCKEAEIEELKDGKWVKTSSACLNV